jgi:hypothetical protein
MSKFISVVVAALVFTSALVAGAQSAVHGPAPRLEGDCRPVAMAQAGRVGETMLVCRALSRALPERSAARHGSTVVVARLGR